MDGLSADKLRVLLHPIKEKKELEPSKEISDKEETKFDLQKAKEVMEQDFRDNMVLATLQDGTRGKWKTAQVMYSFALPHKVMYYIFFKKVSSFDGFFLTVLTDYFFFISLRVLLRISQVPFVAQCRIDSTWFILDMII